MEESQAICLGRSSVGPSFLLPAMANRHGLIAGATGSGKTVTLQLLAEAFSRLGVPVVTADVKGDLAGLAVAGERNPKIDARLAQIGLEEFTPTGCPVLLWDVFGTGGHQLRTTVSELGPQLLARLLKLNDSQQGMLQTAFAIADDEGLLLLDLKDLRALLTWMDQHASELTPRYGAIPKNTLGAIQRRLLNLNEVGGETFFGEPALRLEHILQRDFSGQGVISILDARRLLQEPTLYATFLLWLLSELFEQLEEVGDTALPKLVFFFDEAHLLFDDAPTELKDKIEQVVRLVRSKGVGVFFVTQNPLDIPNDVAAQLGNRIQHGLRAFTPKEQKTIKAVGETFRENPALNPAEVVLELKVGEALVSCLDEQGRPEVVQKVLIAPPRSRIGPLSDSEREEIIRRSPLATVYTSSVDRESAYELLEQRAKEVKSVEDEKPASGSSSRRQSAGEAFFKSLLRSVGSQIGRQIARGLLGSLTRGQR
ncbi:MAG: DUF853 family protein [Bdellovibrionales bacterium]|nr:DUF853 family protein [Bdellovibrionales bacterium]